MEDLCVTNSYKDPTSRISRRLRNQSNSFEKDPRFFRSGSPGLLVERFAAKQPVTFGITSLAQRRLRRAEKRGDRGIEPDISRILNHLPSPNRKEPDSMMSHSDLNPGICTPGVLKHCLRRRFAHAGASLA